MQPKNWKSGKADQVWKVMVCANDAKRVDDLMSGLVYIITETGDIEKGLAALSEMTGKQIVDALKAYKDTAYESVSRALPEGDGAA